MKCKPTKSGPRGLPATGWMLCGEWGRCFDRSTDTKAFKRGVEAYNNSEFYRQLGKDPARLVRSAIEVLARRFSLP